VVVGKPPYVYLVITQPLCYFRRRLAVRRHHSSMVPGVWWHLQARRRLLSPRAKAHPHDRDAYITEYRA
jgi:hypothetical protein